MSVDTLMVNSLGPQTFGAFNYIGQSPTRYLTQTPAGGGAPGEHSRQRLWEQGPSREPAFYALACGQEAGHRSDVTCTPRRTPTLHWAFPPTRALPAGVQNPTWNGRMLELYYTQNLQFIVIARYEDIRNLAPAVRNRA
jgi:hypothetical protein